MACRAVISVLLWLAVMHAPPQLPAVAGQQDDSPPSPPDGPGASSPSPAPGPGVSSPSPAPGLGVSPPSPAYGPAGSPPPPVASPGGSPQLPTGPGGSPPPPSVGCQKTCGDVDIPFPFGIEADGCKLSNGFVIRCNDNGTGVLKPTWSDSNVEVVDISPSSATMRVLNVVSYYCYNESSGMMKPSEWSWDLTGTPLTFSNTANKFTVVGCRTLAYIGNYRNNDNVTTKYETGCVSTCPLDPTALTNGTCSGMGCCQTAIPSGLQNYDVWFDHLLNQTSRWPCSYAVLMEESNFTFSTSYVKSSELYNKLVPVVLDWVVGFDNCSIASTKPGYACVSSNSRCIDATSGRGYICNCTQGFEGNPYVRDGCIDIDECNDSVMYPCYGKCINTYGGFTCSCPAGTRGNASIEQCQKYPFPRKTQIAVGIPGSFLVALVALLSAQVFIHKRSTRRQGYFEHHGGQMLARILETEGINFTFFKRRDIMKATRSFHNANIVGEGAHGAVYKGIISVHDTTITVAVKRCKQIDQSRTAEFVQELVILCRLNHHNVVKLLGCCLHFEAPMLVYEFMQNGTLNDLLHGKSRRRMTLATRLRIAAEAGEALAYLHSPLHMTLHGDVKPENILLDEGWVAKVSDFGCSTINDNIQVVAKGTLAYLDPEFLIDSQITDKTDVYSFGVVLMELLTGKKPLVKGQRNLTIIFQEAMANGTLNELLDADVIMEEGAMGVIHQAAELARRCTSFPGKTRPAMEQVAEELRRLSNQMPERREVLQALQGATPGYINAADESGTTGSYSVGSIAALSTKLAR